MNYKPANPTKDMTGEVYNSLTVVSLLGKRNGKVFWLCRCQCGIERAAESYSLKSGRSIRCGACHAKRAGEIKRTHGLSKTVEYRTWQAMKTRCYNPKSKWFEYWGGRGIEVCDRWRNNFDAFLADVGRRPGDGYSLDRIENDLNYQPGNVRWATQYEQAKNRRAFKPRKTSVSYLQNVDYGK